MIVCLHMIITGACLARDDEASNPQVHRTAALRLGFSARPVFRASDPLPMPAFRAAAGDLNRLFRNAWRWLFGP